MNNELKIKDKIAEGGFGSIYDCKFNDKKCVVKVIELDEDGIENPLEPIIMSSVNCENIQKSTHIYSTEKNLYIVQEKAETDLHKLIKKEKLSFDTIIDILYQIIYGIYVLKKLKIIHGDIKPSNILCFGDNLVKITDFSLSSLWEYRLKRSYFSTSMYRAPEVWEYKDFNYSLDIWSLGCLLYQIYFGSLLFPYQGKGKESRNKYMNSINDWFDFAYPEKNHKYKRYDTEYEKIKISNKWDNNGEIEKLIVKMLNPDPYNRPSVNELLKHHFFKDRKKNSFRIEYLKSSIPDEILKRNIHLINFNEEIRLLISNLYLKTGNLIDIYDDIDVLIGCINIIQKLTGNRLTYQVNVNIEISICNKLKYHLLFFN